MCFRSFTTTINMFRLNFEPRKYRSPIQLPPPPLSLSVRASVKRIFDHFWAIFDQNLRLNLRFSGCFDQFWSRNPDFDRGSYRKTKRRRRKLNWASVLSRFEIWTKNNQVEEERKHMNQNIQLEFSLVSFVDWHPQKLEKVIGRDLHQRIGRSTVSYQSKSSTTNKVTNHVQSRNYYTNQS
jgi:hypothetical protein